MSNETEQNEDGPADEIALYLVELIDRGHAPHRVAAATLALGAAMFDRFHGVGAAARMAGDMYRRCAN